MLPTVVLYGFRKLGFPLLTKILRYEDLTEDAVHVVSKVLIYVRCVRCSCVHRLWHIPCLRVYLQKSWTAHCRVLCSCKDETSHDSILFRCPPFNQGHENAYPVSSNFFANTPWFCLARSFSQTSLLLTNLNNIAYNLLQI